MNAAAQFKKKHILAQAPDIDARYTLEGSKAISEVSGFVAVRHARDNWIGSTIAIKFSE